MIDDLSLSNMIFSCNFNHRNIDYKAKEIRPWKGTTFLTPNIYILLFNRRHFRQSITFSSQNILGQWMISDTLKRHLKNRLFSDFIFGFRMRFPQLPVFCKQHRVIKFYLARIATMFDEPLPRDSSNTQ